MNMVLRIAVGLLLASATISAAQTSQETPIGRWKGESLCTVKPSPCHDETVVYEFAASPEKQDALVWKADKIVNGEQQNMGTLDCSFSTSTRTVTCDMPGKGVWKLTVQGNSMAGTLKLADGTLFRTVSVKRMR